MKLYITVSIFVLYYITAIAGQELSPECNGIREKLTKNMNLLENAANTAQMIQQKDCNSAKNSVKLTKKYGKCLPNGSEDLGMDNVYKNMRFISRIVCENVNKRFLGCFSPENLKQFNQCTNKTIQYMDFIAKQQKKTTDLSDSDKPKTRRKRFLLRNLFSGLSDGLQGRSGGDGNLPVLSTLQDGLSSLQNGGGLLGGGLLGGGGGSKVRNGKRAKSLTSFEHRCCMMHLKSDCFLNKVLHTCADKSELRMYKAFQTVFSLALRDVVDIACGRIETLDQCEKFSNDYDVEQDLGF